MVPALLLLINSAAGCAVEMTTRFVDGPTFNRSAVRDELENELHRPVTFEQTATCDQVTFSVDIGVITVSIQTRGKAMVRRVLERGPDEVHQSVLLAANLLRDPLADHFAGEKALTEAAEKPLPLPQTQPVGRLPTSAFWAQVDATIGITYHGIVSAGVDANAAWQRGWLRVGLSFAHTSALEFNDFSTRFSLVPEVGAQGGPGRLRVGLMLGIGPLLLRDSTAMKSGYFVLPLYRARLSLGVALSDEFELQLSAGYSHAPGETNQFGMLFGNLGVRYRFAQL